jgi:prepilin-type N-terminal cleavage/methylation domain-containing protein
MLSRRAFSLLELLVVLAVAGMLAGLLLPALGMAREQARRAADASALRQIALAWQALRLDGAAAGWPAATAAQWAAELALRGGPDDPRLYCRPDDPVLAAAGREMPLAILRPAAGGGREADPAFLALPLSVRIASGLPAAAALASTPLAWTRGLTAAGHWSADGPYGEAGGFIVFLDGRAVFFRDLRQGGGQLRTWQSGQPTHDIRAALPPGARVLE